MNEKNGSIFSKIGLIIGTIAFIFIAVSVVKETYQKKKIQDQINNLQQEAEKIDKEKLDLRDKIAYFESRDYQEREAKDKLGLQSPDENVVVIKPGITKSFETSEAKNEITAATVQIIPNYRKWWDYFFKY